MSWSKVSLGVPFSLVLKPGEANLARQPCLDGAQHSACKVTFHLRFGALESGFGLASRLEDGDIVAEAGASSQSHAMVNESRLLEGVSSKRDCQVEHNLKM